MPGRQALHPNRNVRLSECRIARRRRRLDHSVASLRGPRSVGNGIEGFEARWKLSPGDVGHFLPSRAIVLFMLRVFSDRASECR